MAACNENGPGPPRKRLFNQRDGFSDLWPIPPRTILEFEKNQIAGIIETRIAPGVVQQHQSEKRRCFRSGLRRHQAQTSRASRMASLQRSARTRVSLRVAA